MSGYGQHLEDATKKLPRSTMYRKRKRQRSSSSSSPLDETVDINNENALLSQQEVSHERSSNNSINSQNRQVSTQNSSASLLLHETDSSNHSQVSLASIFSSNSATNHMENQSNDISNDFYGLQDANDSLQVSWQRDCYEESFSEVENNSSDDCSEISEENDQTQHDESNSEFHTFNRLLEIINSEEANEPLNTPVMVSKCEIMLAIMKFSLTYNLNQSAIADLFKMLNCIIGLDIFPQSRYRIDQIFNTTENIDYHAICPECENYFGTFDPKDRLLTCTCGARFSVKHPLYTNFFTIMNVKKKIASLVRNNDKHLNFIKTDRHKNKECFEDFSDGLLYKHFMESLPVQEQDNFITTTFNTDGAPLFESSKFSIWPIQIIINELPFKVRAKNPIVCGLWFGKNKPNMQIFLKQFVIRMNDLANEGITYVIDNVQRKLKVYSLCACVDSVARPPMQGMVQYNGYNGCGWCKHPGVYVATETGGGSVKYVLLNYIPNDRTELDMLRSMQASLMSRNPVDGIKNPTPLINLRAFNIVSGFVPDSMHNVYLGIAEQFLNYWIETSREPYSLSKHDIEIINDMLTKIKVPSKIARLSRGIVDRKFWKAKEYENWLFYYCIPILSFFPHMAQYVEHFSLLVHAIYLLSKDNVSNTDVGIANYKILKFIGKTELYYGPGAMSYNVHISKHLIQSVKHWGPLWSHSGYCFESGNGELTRKVMAAKGVIHQLCRILNMKSATDVLEEHVKSKPHTSVHSFVTYLDKKTAATYYKLTKPRYFGPHRKTKRTLREQFDLSDRSKTYFKMILNNCYFTSCRRKNIRSNNSYAITKYCEYIRLIGFVVDEETQKEYTVCNTIQTENILRDSFHMKKIVNICDELSFIETKDIDRICVLIQIDDVDYIGCIPNLKCF